MTSQSADELSLERAAFDTERDGFDLFRAACLLPRVEGRAVSVQDCVEEIERYAAEVRRRAGAGASDAARTQALVDVLFTDAGFVGDREEYDAPRNSFLPDVLARRRGLPIMLSLVTTTVAQAAGLRASHCVPLPGHVIALVHGGADLGARPALLDPFRGGAVVELGKLLDSLGVQADPADVLVPPHPGALLGRMLTNLRQSYLRRHDVEPHLRVIDRLLLLRPRDPSLFLERAHLRHLLFDVDGARLDAEKARVLARDPDDEAAAASVLDMLTKAPRWIQ